MIFALEIDFDQAAIDASADAFITLTKLADAIPFVLTVSGYNRNAGELSEFPEVLAYLREWHDAVKHKGGVFDSLDEISQSLLLVACRMGSKRSGEADRIACRENGTGLAAPLELHGSPDGGAEMGRDRIK